MSITDPYLHFLGKNVRSKVTGLSGIVTSVSFDLAGCIQVAVQQQIKADGQTPGGQWCDVQALEVTGGPVMPQPDFREQSLQAGPNGPSDLPPPRC